MGSEATSLPPEPPTIEFAGSPDARLFFSGPPHRLTGTIPLINTTAAKQNLRSLSVNGGELLGRAQLPLREVPFSVRLGPAEQADIRGVIALHSTTPPGSYDIEMQIGSKTVPATAHVSEVVDLESQPASLTILAGGDSSYIRKVTVHNAGNIPLLSGSRCETPIFDSFDPQTAGLIGLSRADRKSSESMLKGALEEMAELHAGMLVITREAIVLRPGETRVVDLEFQLPPELKPLRHYRATLQLYNALLGIEIYTSAKINSKRK
jgi:hypothetical protein